MKICQKCGCEKDLVCFNKNKLKKDGLDSFCRECCSQRAKLFYLKNENRLRVASKERYSKDKEKHKLSVGKYRSNNKIKLKLKEKEYYSNKNNKRKRNERLKARRKEDIKFRITAALRSRMANALNGAIKSQSTIELLGASVQDVKKYLESKFTEGMSWDKFGTHGIHIDHIRPCASFDLTDPAQQNLCFHYSNLQPLWAKDNLTKKDHWPYEPDNSRPTV